MKFAIIDTETSGLFNFAQPADAPGQPRLATLAIITALIDERGALNAVRELSFIVKPDGWKMQPEATVVNGLTTEHLLEHGEPVLGIIASYANLIDNGHVVASFNAQFDLKVMRGEMRRAGIPDRFELTPNVCIMRALTGVCRVPRKSGGGYKFPKLSEACAHFKIVEPAAHSAMGDARSALALLRQLHRLNLVPKPEVHFAKAPPAAAVSSPL